VKLSTVSDGPSKKYPANKKPDGRGVVLVCTPETLDPMRRPVECSRRKRVISAVVFDPFSNLPPPTGPTIASMIPAVGFLLYVPFKTTATGQPSVETVPARA
jgi:hypothetical protein